MNMAPIVARLSAQVSALAIVGGAAELAAATEALAASPAAFVLEEDTAARENQVVTEVHQRLDVTLGVYLAVKNAKDSRGESGQGDLETLRIATRDALLGWTPGGDVEPLTYAGGRLFSFQPGLIWWRESFRTAHYIRSAL